MTSSKANNAPWSVEIPSSTLSVLIITLGLISHIAITVYFSKTEFIFNRGNLVLSILLVGCFAIGSLVSLLDALAIKKEEYLSVEAINTLSLKPSLAELNAFREAMPRGLLADAVIGMGRNGPRDISPHASQRTATTYTSFVQYLAGAVMLLGLLGSFLGLIDSIKSYPNLIHGSQSSLSVLDQLLHGLEKAFGTTIIGIYSSLFLGLFVLTNRVSESKLRAAIYRFSTSVHAATYGDRDDDIITTIIEKSFMRFIPSIMKEISGTLSSAGDKISLSADRICESSSNLVQAVNNIDEASQALGDYGQLLEPTLQGINNFTQQASTANQQLVAAAGRFMSSQTKSHDDLKLVSDNFSGAFLEYKNLLASATSIIDNLSAMGRKISALNIELADMIRENKVAISAWADIGRSLSERLKYERRDVNKMDSFTPVLIKIDKTLVSMEESLKIMAARRAPVISDSPQYEESGGGQRRRMPAFLARFFDR